MIAKDIGFPNGDPRNATGRAVIDGTEWRMRDEAAGALAAWNLAHIDYWGRPLPVNETMRDLNRQWHLYTGWVNRQPGFNLAGYPGTSIHGWGLAADIDTDWVGGPHQQWLAASSRAYGFWPAGLTFSQVESWHFEYDADHITPETRSVFALAGTAQASITTQEDDMNIGTIARIRGEGTRVRLYTGSGVLEGETDAQVNAFFIVTRQSRRDIPEMSRAEHDAYVERTSWQHRGLFQVLDRHEATIRAQGELLRKMAAALGVKE